MAKAPQYPAPLNWVVHHKELVGIVLAALAVVIGVAELRWPASSTAPAASPTVSTPVGPSSPGSGVASLSDAGTPPAAGSSGSTPVSACVDTSNGTSASCTAPDAAVPVKVRSSACVYRDVLLQWTLTPELDALDLSIDTGPAGCAVAPGQFARSAGATARDVLAASRGTVTASLRECTDSTGNQPLPCSSRHTVEWVGTWFRLPDSEDLAVTCADRGARYTGMVLSGTSRLVATSFRAGDQVRCAVMAEAVTLTGSVRSLDGRPLPQ